MNKVAGLLRERQEARAAKDFARSDAARDELAALGVEVRDWNRKTGYPRTSMFWTYPGP